MRAVFRLSRAAAVAGVSVLLAAGAHTAAGGALPDPLILAALLALSLVAVMLISGRKISATAMLAVLSATQLVLHEAFIVLSEGPNTAPVLAPGSEHVHVLGMMASSGGAHVHSEGPEMLAAHAVATLATALVLARGEAAVWALLSWLRPLVRMLAALVLLPAPAVPTFTQEHLPRVWRSLRLPARRGPPSAFAVA
ncbi:hypothetical protein [Sinomonas albida]|uniref:hypothetical protein n=1 Tax=Sinomonas albida TaxID=369942 RepID=UPI00301A77E8